MKLQNIVLAMIATLAVVSTAQAAIVDGQSYPGGSGTNSVDVGETSGGVSGAAVDGVLGGTLTPFSHFTAFGADGNGVYKFKGTDIPVPSHHPLGIWAFKSLGHSDAWFGEWSKENKSGSTYLGTPDLSTRTVFYIGNNTGLTLPSSGTVNYSVKGLNDYYTNGTQLSGTLTADFGSNKHITGSLSRTIGANTDTLTFTNVKFNGSTGKIDSSVSGGGSVSATYNSLGLSGTGDAYGQFFGNQSSAGNGGLAGFAKFSNRNLDTAFGGKN